MRFVSPMLFATALAVASSPALAVPVTLTKLTGTVGGTPDLTAIFKADLSTLGLSSILSISIMDSNSGLGGTSGAFSGFDFDGIKLSTVDCADAACAAAAADAGFFSFTSSGVVFTPGTQRAPVDPKLFGTDISGVAVDFGLATLGLFDANATTGPTAAGYVSLGDGGTISFNLLSALATSGLFLYIGEVGDNGEAAASNIVIADTAVPEPATFGLMGLGLLGLGYARSAAKVSRRKAA
jgi:hypothetical protein